MPAFDDTPQPVKPAPSLAKSRVGGAILIGISLAFTYFFVWQPLQQARASNTFTYSMKAVLLAPAILYMGCCVLVTDMRDGQAMETRADGKKYLTRKGYFFVGGLIVVEGLALLAWSLYLKSLGYSAF